MSRRAVRTVPRTFLFADLRGYTAYVERAGDAEAAHLLHTYRGLVRRAVTREQGAEVKTEGDSFYVVFESSAAAVRCAVAIQRAAARRRGEVPLPLGIGIGIHAGEAAPFDAQYVGSAVNIAARLASAATAGEILISETVRNLVRTAVRFDLDDRGPLALRGVTESVRAYGIRLGDSPAELPPTGPASAMAALLRGDLDTAARIARSLPTGAPAEARCDALAALTVIAAARGDVETALGRAEPLLTAALHAGDRAWVRTAYALRAWLYGLARQPAEGQAELARAFERPGSRGEACLALLLATTLLGSPRDAERLRQVAASCPDATLQQACGIVADALEDSVAPAGRSAIRDGVVGPFIGGLLQAQLTGRIYDRSPRALSRGPSSGSESASSK
jgi:class 3 adenylate cyclase